MRKSGDVQLQNCIVWGNTPAPQLTLFAPSTITPTYTDVQGGFPGSTVFSADPHFADPVSDFRLLVASSCIDAGDNGAVPAGIVLDAAGNDRFVDDPAVPDGLVRINQLPSAFGHGRCVATGVAMAAIALPRGRILAVRVDRVVHTESEPARPKRPSTA